MDRKLRMGMIGGGKGAFIGAVHRIAANMDGLIDLHCGAFSSDAARSKLSGSELMLPEEKAYGSFEEMIMTEKGLPASERMDFVSIVTPNNAHFEPAMMALQNGFHVMIEKPITFNLQQAKQLKAEVERTGLLLGLTHTYAGYPLVKQAKQMVAAGKLGSIRKIMVTYTQGWLSQAAEKEGNAQASWRTDPARSGAAGCMGDIGTHAAHLAEYISGLKIIALCAQLNTVVPGRQLDDDGTVLLRFEENASGVLIASQIAAGEENNLSINIYGEKGGLEWRQQEPNTLIIKWTDKPAEILRTGSGYLSSYAQYNTRTPGGHPEGYLEAFANIYRSFAHCLRARSNGEELPEEAKDFPGVEEGVRGMAFIENVVASAASSAKWNPFNV